MINKVAPTVVYQPTKNEVLKQQNPSLSGTILKELNESGTDRFSDDDYEFLKFHGAYQQDDRDKRKIARHYMLMVRGRLPGGVVTADQYLAFDQLSSAYGNNTLRITSRQGLQFHGVLKRNLRAVIRGINEALATTLAACGDVNRNVMAPPTPAMDGLGSLVADHARKVSNALLPTTPAYHEIWIDGTTINLSPEANRFVDPLYGEAYLPRKFKIAFAIPPLNDVDVYTNDLGFVAVAERGELVGYNILAGGGLGTTHGNTETFPRLADLIAFIEPRQLLGAAKAVLTIHRDFGDRTNRKHARLKYVLEERGVEWFRSEVESRLGEKLQAARPFTFTRQGDKFGWHPQHDGHLFLGLFVETGRIKDDEKCQFKTALRKVVGLYRPDIRLTPSQNLLLVNIKPADQSGVTEIFTAHGIRVEHQASIIRRLSMACPALPTCGLALAESERVFPTILTEIEEILVELGLSNEEIVIRCTGCPNGCARPYTAEIGIVGRAPGKYQIYLGGNGTCTRLNQLWKNGVRMEDIASELRPVLTRYSVERGDGERFGDWCARHLIFENLNRPPSANAGSDALNQ